MLEAYYHAPVFIFPLLTMQVGAGITYAFAILPILFLGVGSSSPGIIVALVSIIKTRIDSDYKDRRVQHEAAHFLAGYLCGLPIKSYKVRPPFEPRRCVCRRQTVTPVNDMSMIGTSCCAESCVLTTAVRATRSGPPAHIQVDGATTEIEFYETTKGDQATIDRKLKRPEIDSFSVVALSGAVGEVLKFGSSTGSAQDLDVLGRLMNRCEPPMRGPAQEMQTRWAALTAYKLLKKYSKEYDALIQAFREKRSIPECIAALETVQ